MRPAPSTRFPWLVALALALAAAGCSGANGDESTATGASSTAQPSATGAPGGTPTAADALLLDWSYARATTGGALLPIGPASAAPEAGASPIDIGNAQIALSPSGRRAAIAHLALPPDGVALRIVDTSSWSELATLDKPLSMNLFAWTPDSERLFTFRAALGRDESGAATAQYDLWDIDVDAETATRISEVDYEPVSLHPAPDGARLYVLGREPNRFDATMLVAYDVASGVEAGRAALPGVLAGTGPLLNGVAEKYDPGIAVAPDGSRLYVAHATGDEITVVDLATLAVTQQEAVRAPRPPLERALAALRGLLPRPASAHALSVQRRQAAISPDGGTLYVAGSSDDVCAPDATSCVHHRPFGLRAIDSATLELTASRPDIGWFATSRDGATILGIGFSLDEVAVREGRGGVVGHGLQVLDARTLELRAHVRPEESFAQVVVGAGGDAAYLMTADEPPRVVLFRFSLNEVSSEWRLPATGAVLVGSSP